MRFKVGDRVKVIKDEDDLGYLGQLGKVFESDFTDGAVPVEFDTGKEAYFWEHELQLIPMAIAGQFESADEVQRKYVEEWAKASAQSSKPHTLREQKFLGDSGQRSETGSLRYNTGKPKMSLVTPEFILGMAQVLTKGAEKYGERNWELGNKTSVPYDSAMRHILAWRSGEDEDEESGCNHLFHAAVNLLMCWYYAENFSSMDDRTLSMDDRR